MKTYKPTSKSRRAMSNVTYRGVLTKTEPTKSLTHGFRRAVGRNSHGRITTRHKGGGHKRLFRDVDFKYDKNRGVIFDSNQPIQTDAVKQFIFLALTYHYRKC